MSIGKFIFYLILFFFARMKESVAMRKDDAEMSTCRKAGRDLRWGVSLLDTSLTVTFPGNDFSPFPQGFHKWMANLGRMHFTQDPAHGEPSCVLQRLQQAPQNTNGNSPSGLKVFLLNYIEFFEDFISPGTELEGVNLDIHSIHLKDWLH